MNRLDLLFEKKSSNLLSVYFTAGYPKLNDTTGILQNLENQGADFVEIGIPFSDPVADGEIIQHSNKVALNNGMTMQLLFDQLQSFDCRLPIVLMGYFNPILQLGIEKFTENCAKVKVCGIIIPDLPLEVFEQEYCQIFQKHNLYFIPLVTPQTTSERLIKIGSVAKSFVYVVSQNSITGKHLQCNEYVEYYKKVRQKISNPLITGFGIRNYTDFAEVCKHVNGAIIGSAFIKALTKTLIPEEKQY